MPTPFSPTPMLPLETFRSIIGFNPYHFWGWGDNEALAQIGNCNPVVYEFGWQANMAGGREDVRQALSRAEIRLAELLGYEVAPKYKSNTVKWPHYYDTRMMRTAAMDSSYGWLSVNVGEGYVQATGIEALTPILLAAAVTYQDLNGDGYYDQFTVGPIATTVTDVAEIAAYFSAAERYDGSDASARWRVEPLRIVISGGQVTIYGPAWIMARPIFYSESFSTQILDPATPANFVTTLDIYQRTTNGNGTTEGTSQGVIIWETKPCHGWWCCCSSCSTDPYAGSPADPAATARAVARVGIRNSELGFVTPGEATYNATSGIWSSNCWSVCTEPDRVLIRYLAGYPLTNGAMDRTFQEVVAIMAAAEMTKPICGCEDVNKTLYRWQYDLSKIGSEKELYAQSDKIMLNPIGTRRGHVYVWERVKDLLEQRAVLS